MYFVYAIYSESRNYIYVGLSNDFQRRIKEHNLGYNKTTKPYRPFVLIHHEQFQTRTEARSREKSLKTTTGKRFLRKILKDKN